jgi:hypothetical protein
MGGLLVLIVEGIRIEQMLSSESDERVSSSFTGWGAPFEPRAMGQYPRLLLGAE